MKPIIVLLALLAGSAGGADAPLSDGDIFVDQHACPGEGCGYGMLYKAVTTVIVFEKPSLEAAIAGEYKPGDTFSTEDGEVHTEATKFVVDREHDQFKPGDQVLVLTYSGEGRFRIYHNGELTTADLNFSPWGSSGGKTCDKPKRCWGHLTRGLKFTWWMRVTSEVGPDGWVMADGSAHAIDN